MVIVGFDVIICLQDLNTRDQIDNQKKVHCQIDYHSDGRTQPPLKPGRLRPADQFSDTASPGETQNSESIFTCLFHAKINHRT